MRVEGKGYESCLMILRKKTKDGDEPSFSDEELEFLYDYLSKHSNPGFVDSEEEAYE
jgi:hypothetical protein